MDRPIYPSESDADQCRYCQHVTNAAPQTWLCNLHGYHVYFDEWCDSGHVVHRPMRGQQGGVRIIAALLLLLMAAVVYSL